MGVPSCRGFEVDVECERKANEGLDAFLSTNSVSAVDEKVFVEDLVAQNVGEGEGGGVFSFEEGSCFRFTGLVS